MLSLVGLIFGLSIVGGCGGGGPVNLTVLGAASLKTALDQVRATYEESHAGTTITISTGSSTALRTQIEQGAPADVFLSADTANPQALSDAGQTDGATVNFATNLLTIAVANGNPGGVTSAADLGRSGVRVVAALDDVPITKYAKQCVDRLSAVPGYPAGFAAAYEANIISREENVGAVTSKIALGEGDAAIVYVTDAKAATLQTVEIPAEGNAVATYAGVVLRSSANTAASHALLDWIRGGEGQVILSNLGFSPAP